MALLFWLMVGCAPLLTWLFSFLVVLAYTPPLQPLPVVSAVLSKKRRNVLLVIAHPDDESMFFAPTLLSLARLGCYNVRILCLSNGNAEGLGIIREQEMLSACSVLKVSKENVDILNDPALQDGHSVIWSSSLILQVLNRTLNLYNIDMIITFDSYGVSGHPNHIAVHRSVCEFLFAAAKEKQESIEVWKLESTSFIKKYSGPIYVLWSMWRYTNTNQSHQFYNRGPQYSIGAMRKHTTQWLWYRRLFVILSTYTYMNTLRRVST